MSKKDLNYIRLIKHQIKEKEKSDQSAHRYREFHRMESLARADQCVQAEQHDKRCKEAAVMSNYERLINYAGTHDATYLGQGCNWDTLTRPGLKKRGL
jgi:hypothetical protein